jgi:hypothetical protein
VRTREIESITLGRKVTPMWLFQEYSFFHSRDLVRDVLHYCVDRGWFPYIDHDPSMNAWVFHSISSRDRVWRKPIAVKYNLWSIAQLSGSFSEADLEEDVSTYLDKAGISYQRQFSCKVGVADIVTEAKVYELKKFLTKSNFFGAVGQVLLYGDCINPAAGMAILCYVSAVPQLHKFAYRRGIEVIEWLKHKRH